MIAIKQEIIDQVKKNTRAKTMLAYEFSKHFTTIERWLDVNDPMLTTPAGIRVISEQLEIPESELLTEA